MIFRTEITTVEALVSQFLKAHLEKSCLFSFSLEGVKTFSCAF